MNSTTPRTNTAPVVIAVIAGMVLWVVASLLSAKREAWDGPAYWVVAYPLAIATCAWLGLRFPERPWRWALLLFESQFIVMCLRNAELGSLWPLGMLLFAALALPAIVAAQVAARLHRNAEAGV